MIQTIIHHIPHAILFMMALGLLCISLSDRTQKEPVERCKGCATCQPKAQRERFGDHDGQSDYSNYLEARQKIDRARKASWN